MSRRALLELAAFCLLLTAGAAGTVSGWARGTGPSQDGIRQAALAGVQERLSFAGLSPSYLKVNAVNGDVVNMTVRVGDMPAFQLNASMVYAWHAAKIESFNRG